MILRNTSTSYGTISILLHWLVAVAVIGLFVSGLWMVDLGYYDPWYNRAPALHRSVGIVVVFLVMARIAWRWVGGVPKPEPGTKRWENRVAHLVHLVLIFGVLAIAAAGYLMSTAKGAPIIVFDLFAVPATIHGLPGQADVAGDVHYWLAVALIGVAGLHALAAFKHHFVDRDATLLRMLGMRRAHRTRTDTPLSRSDQ